MKKFFKILIGLLIGVNHWNKSRCSSNGMVYKDRNGDEITIDCPSGHECTISDDEAVCKNASRKSGENKKEGEIKKDDKIKKETGKDDLDITMLVLKENELQGGVSKLKEITPKTISVLKKKQPENDNEMPTIKKIPDDINSKGEELRKLKELIDSAKTKTVIKTITIKAPPKEIKLEFLGNGSVKSPTAVINGTSVVSNMNTGDSKNKTDDSKNKTDDSKNNTGDPNSNIGESKNNFGGPNNNTGNDSKNDTKNPNNSGNDSNNNASDSNKSSGKDSATNTSSNKKPSDSPQSGGLNSNNQSSNSNVKSDDSPKPNTSNDNPSTKPTPPGSNETSNNQQTASKGKSKEGANASNDKSKENSNDKSKENSNDKSKENSNGKSKEGGNDSKNNSGGGNIITAEDLKKAMEENNMKPKDEYIKAVVEGVNKDFKDKAMAAQFLAQTAHESGGFQYVEEIKCKDTGCPGEYGSSEGAPGKSYYGRGFMQLSWPANYKEASKAIHGDEKVLLDDPDKVAKDPTEGYQVSQWFWKNKVETAENVGPEHFGYSTKAINGALECTGSNVDKSKKRYTLYKSIAKIMKLEKVADEKGCYN